MMALHPNHEHNAGKLGDAHDNFTILSVGALCIYSDVGIDRRVA